MWKRTRRIALTLIDGLFSNLTRIAMAMVVNMIFVFVAGAIFAAFVQKTDITNQEVQTALAGAGIAVALAQTLLLWLMWDVVDLVDRRPWFEDQAPDVLDDILTGGEPVTVSVETARHD